MYHKCQIARKRIKDILCLFNETCPKRFSHAWFDMCHVPERSYPHNMVYVDYRSVIPIMCIHNKK